MLILDKKENIRTLFNLGTEVSSLRKIFLYQGIFITILGTLIGLALGTGIILAQQHYFSARRILESAGYRIVLLTGSLEQDRKRTRRVEQAHAA